MNTAQRTSTRRQHSRRAFIAMALIVIGLLGVQIARGGTIEVDTFHTGGFYGLDAMGMPTATPDNDMSFQNYFMGHTTVSGFTTPERRAFFAFDLSGVLVDGEEIVSMSLVLENVFGGVMANFTDGFEIAKFTSTSSTYDMIADPDGAMVPAIEIFDTFGTGEFYGDIVFDADGPMPGPVEIAMSPDAIMNAMDSIGADSPFMITGMMETYDPAPGIGLEFLFGLTDVVDGVPTGFPVPKLVIETAPVPAPSGLMALAGAGLIASKRRR